MLAIASLGCEAEMRAIASSMKPNAYPRQGSTPIFFSATPGGITIVSTASAADKTMLAIPARERQIDVRGQGLLYK
jgi:hypothetical protein